MKLTIEGRVPSKKNSKRLVMVHGRLIPISSKAYMAWHADAVKQVRFGQSLPIAKSFDHCSVIITFYAPDKRGWDLNNMSQGIMDLLVECKIIEDDNWKVCPDLHLKFGGVDRLNPRAEVEIL